MARGGPKIAILSIAGTNCDEELGRALSACGARPEIVDLAQFAPQGPSAPRRRLDEFAALFFPGGFSGGDYVRAGAIFAARVRATVGPDLEAFVKDGRLVAGICNGFQVLTELGLLPGRPDGRLGTPEAALMANASGHFECRPTFVAFAGARCPALPDLPVGDRFLFPSAHGEGKLALAGDPIERLRMLEHERQILFRWVAPDGGAAHYPWNPNGSIGDVAGLCNPSGNVVGLMPHPERNFFRDQAPDWTRDGRADGWGDGHRFLSALVQYAARASPAVGP